MRPILSQLLCDNESLLEYERTDGIIDFHRVRNRLIATERTQYPQRSDSYYEGLGMVMTEKYHSLSELLWLLPYDLSKDYLYMVNHKVYVKAERFNGWMDMLCQLPPLFLVAGFFLDRFSLGFLNKPTDFSDFKNRDLIQFKYTAQLLPYIKELEYMVDENKGLNDLHIHLNGSTESDVVWNYLLLHPYKTVTDYKDVFYGKNGKVRRLSEQIMPGFNPDILLNRLFKAKQLRSGIIRKVLNHCGYIPEQLFTEDLYVDSLWHDFISPKNESPLIDELIFYLLVMSSLRESHNDRLAAEFHHYLLIKGLMHRFMVMQQSQIGFSQFQLLTDVSFRNGIEEFYRDRFLQLGGGTRSYLGMIEGRFSPKGNKMENLRLIKRIKSGFEKACRENEFMHECKLGLIAHFIKRPDTCKTLPVRHRFLRKDLRKRALSLIRLLKNNAECKDLVKGVDAAASEFDAGPDVFAPIFRFLRKEGISHFTYHVGEDFNHLLTGLRVVYEAVEFLDLQPGDRLGHCTALGISPTIWIERNAGVCYMSRLNWLDNLVFVWELIKETRHESLQSLKLIVESEIAELTECIYGAVYHPYVLVEAWKLRKYDPFLYLDSEKEFNDKIGRWNRMDSIEEVELIEKSLSIEHVRKLYHCYHASAIDSTEANKMIEIKTTEIIGEKELGIIQRLILDRLSRKGIVIESLPTSNLRISYYQRMKEHHLMKWLKEDTEQYGMPFVVLGTDDPGIFSTNIYNEYARAYLHLQECGWSSSERLQKIGEIHKWSSIYKFIGNEK